jgi:hypothetical protein
MTFDLYGHLFENIEPDCAYMAKIEAAVAGRLTPCDKVATCAQKR